MAAEKTPPRIRVVLENPSRPRLAPRTRRVAGEAAAASFVAAKNAPNCSARREDAAEEWARRAVRVVLGSPRGRGESRGRGGGVGGEGRRDLGRGPCAIVTGGLSAFSGASRGGDKNAARCAAHRGRHREKGRSKIQETAAESVGAKSTGDSTKTTAKNAAGKKTEIPRKISTKTPGKPPRKPRGKSPETPRRVPSPSLWGRGR